MRGSFWAAVRPLEEESSLTQKYSTHSQPLNAILSHTRQQVRPTTSPFSALRGGGDAEISRGT